MNMLGGVVSMATSSVGWECGLAGVDWVVFTLVRDTAEIGVAVTVWEMWIGVPSTCVVAMETEFWVSVAVDGVIETEGNIWVGVANTGWVGVVNIDWDMIGWTGGIWGSEILSFKNTPLRWKFVPSWSTDTCRGTTRSICTSLTCRVIFCNVSKGRPLCSLVRGHPFQ